VTALLALVVGVAVGGFASGLFRFAVQVPVVTTTQVQELRVTVRETVTATTVVVATPVPVTADSFLGEWHNVQQDSPGIVRAQISHVGVLYQIHLWGQCHPDLCDWGNVQLYFYSRDVGTSPNYAAYYGVAVYQFGFETVYVLTQFINNQQLQIMTLTHFTDASGRSDYYASGIFQR
jgi:hypothetical protein